MVGPGGNLRPTRDAQLFDLSTTPVDNGYFSIHVDSPVADGGSPPGWNFLFFPLRFKKRKLNPGEEVELNQTDRLGFSYNTLTEKANGKFDE